MAYFPLFIDLWGQEILVVGGGPIAARRIRVLREFGCRILAVAPEAVTEHKRNGEGNAGDCAVAPGNV